jgi:hypothetical protein
MVFNGIKFTPHFLKLGTWIKSLKDIQYGDPMIILYFMGGNKLKKDIPLTTHCAFIIG